MSRTKQKQRRLLYGISLAAALAVALTLILATQLGGGTVEPPSVQVAGQGTTTLLAGIPQDGTALGSPDAPVTIVEFADFQCPYCGQWSTQVFPTLVEDYVRTGKVRVVFNGMAFLGPDSERALRAALAAGEQDRLWNVAHLLYQQQGGENEGWVTEELLRGIGHAAPGLDVDRMLETRTEAGVERQLASSAQAATAAGIAGTPSFLIGPTGGDLEPLVVDRLEPSAFRPAIEAALAA
jgi:protein-disulfide isomerase